MNSLPFRYSVLRAAIFAALGYLGLIAGVYGTVLFGHSSLHPSLLQPYGVTDKGAWGYDGRTPVNTFNLDHADPGYTQWPINKFIGEQYRNGNVPLWNPHQGSGEPVVAQYSTRALFPYQILQNISPVETWDFFLLGRVWFAGLFTFFFLRKIGLNGMPAFLGGAIYMFSGAFTWFLTLEQLTNTSMVMPLLLLAMEGAAKTLSFRWMAAAAVAMALVLLGGQPESALYVIVVGGGYYIMRAIQFWGIRRWRIYVAISLSGLTALMLASPQLLPFLELLQQGHTLHSPDARMGTRDALPWTWLAAIVSPSLYSLPRPFPVIPLNGLWDYVGGYVGASVITLILFGAFQKQRHAGAVFFFFVSVGVVLLLKHAGISPFYWIGYLPLFDLSWSHRWAGPVWQLGFAIAAAIALSNTEKQTSQGMPMKAAPLVASGFIALAAGLFFIIFKMTPSPAVASLGGMVMSVVILGGALALTWTSTTGKKITAVLFPSGEEEGAVVRRLGFVAFGLSVVSLGHVLLRLDVGRDTLLIELGWWYFSFLAGVFSLALLVAIFSPNSLITAVRLVERNKATVASFLLVSLLVGTSVLSYPELLIDQVAHAKIAQLTGTFPILLNMAILAWLLKTRPSDAWRNAAVAVLIFNELLLFVPRGYGGDDEWSKLAPWAGGVIVVVLVAMQFRKSALVLSALCIGGVSYIDFHADQGLPRPHDPFVAAPYTTILTNDSYARVMGGGGVLMPTYASALGLYDIRHIQSVSIKAYQNFADKHLQEAVPMTGSMLWFTGFPVRNISDVRPRETMWFRDYAYKYAPSPENQSIAVERVKNDFARNHALYSFLGVRYLLLPAWTDLASVARFLPNGKELPLLYDGEIRVFRNPYALPRAFIVHDVSTADTFEDAQRVADKMGLKLSTSAVVEATVPEGIRLPGHATAVKELSQAEIVEYSPNAVRILAQSEADGLLVLSDTFYDGWKVTVGGVEQDIVRVNGVVRGVWLTAGEHEITFFYEPQAYRTGLILALVGLLLCVGMLLTKPKSETG